MHKKKKKINTKNIILVVGLLFMLIDIIFKLIFISYNMNLLYIAVLLFALANMNRNKKWFSAILIIAIIFMGINLTSKTYLEKDGLKLEIPRFTYKTKTGYKSLMPLQSIDKKIEKTLEKYEALGCGFNYYYDKKSDVTILNYNVNKNKIISIETKKGNECTKLKTNKYKNFKEIEDLSKQTLDELVNEKYYVYKDGMEYNKEEFNEFKKSKKDKFIRMVTFTSEETYIIFDIKYYNGVYEVRYTNEFNNEEEIVQITRQYDNINLDDNEILMEYDGKSIICAKHN